MAQQILSTNTFTTAKWIVSATSSDGTHTTIGAALTSASSGDTIFIRPGTYTENLTLKAGVNLTAFESDSSLNGTGKVIISGTCTFTAAGTVTISGIELQTNSAALLAVTGSAASIVNLNNCYLNCSNNTGISFTSSNGSSSINVYRCNADISTTGIALFASTSAGTLSFDFCISTNSGSSTTASTFSGAGTLVTKHSEFNSPITTSGTSNVDLSFSRFECTVINTLALTIGGSGAGQNSNHLLIASGTATALSVGANGFTLYNSIVSSTNATSAISGGGTLKYAEVSYANTSLLTVTTQVIAKASSFQKVVTQIFTSTGTYTPTSGMKYCIIEAIGGGGAGGGAAATNGSQESFGAGGGAGEYARGVFTAAIVGTSQSVTIGAAGTANSGVAGGAGGNTSVGSTLISSNGGSGGATAAAGGNGFLGGTLGGTGGTGGDFRTPGNPGFGGVSANSPLLVFGGNGGSSQYGAGGTVPSINSAGAAGLGYGSGGSGGVNITSQSAVLGGAGVKGIVIITEFV